MIYDRRYPMRPTAAKGFDLFFQPHEAMRRAESSWIDGVLANGADEVVIDALSLVAPIQPGERMNLLEAPGPLERALTLIRRLRGGPPSSL